MKQPHKTLLIWVVLIVAFLAIWQFLVPAGQPKKQRPFSDFIELVKAPKDKPHVESVDIRYREYSFVVKRPGAQGAPGAKRCQEPPGRSALWQFPSSLALL